MNRGALPPRSPYEAHSREQTMTNNRGIGGSIGADGTTIAMPLLKLIRQIVRVPWGWTWIRLTKFFSLQILVAQVVLIENPLDDIASPLGISSNMLIKAAITRNPFCPILAEVNMLEQ